jgi:hypothetical protein
MGPDIMNAVKMAEENNIAPTEELGRMFNLYKENSPEFRQFLEIDKKEGS